MVKKPPVKCPQCGRSFYREDGIENVDWIHIKNRYWHVACHKLYEQFRETVDIRDNLPDERWYQELRDYLWFDVKLPEANWAMIDQQWNSFLKKHYTAKGIYFTIRYFYNIKNGDTDKANGGIGIVPFIYREAQTYWQSHRAQMESLMTQIVSQRRLKDEQEQNQRVVSVSRKKKNRIKVLDLSEIEGEEGEPDS